MWHETRDTLSWLALVRRWLVGWLPDAFNESTLCFTVNTSVNFPKSYVSIKAQPCTVIDSRYGVNSNLPEYRIDTRTMDGTRCPERF